MLNVQRFIKEKGLKQLIEEFELTVNETDDLVQLNYNMINSPVNEITNECRGLILEKGTWRVVAKAFDRFFNFNEGKAADIDCASAKAYEKIDGSLILLYFYKGSWRVATRGSINAGGKLPTSDLHKSFAELFWKILDVDNTESVFLKNYTYVFELASMHNRVVKTYEQPELYLLTVVNVANNNYPELPQQQREDFAKQIGVKTPYAVSVEDIDKMVAKANDLPVGDEGFVIVDKNNNRIKIKSKTYLELHKTVNNGKPNIWRLLLSGDLQEFLKYFPAYKEDAKSYVEIYNETLALLETLWSETQGIKDRKEFALKVKDSYVSCYMFLALKGEETPLEIFNKADLEKRVKFFEKNIKE